MSHKLHDWILNGSQELNFSIRELIDIKTYIPSLTSLEVSLTLDEKTVRGYGKDFNEDIAISKATVEAIERLVLMFTDGLTTSNGIAGHVCEESAIENASYELIERDAFMFHYITGQPVRWYTPLDSLSLIPNDFRSFYTTRNSFVQIGKMDTGNGLCGVIVSSKLKGGVIISIGVGINESNAIYSAVIQHIGLYLSVSPLDNYSLNLNDFNNAKVLNVRDHLRLGLDKEFSRKFIKNISNGNSTIFNALPLKTIKTERLIPENDKLKEVIARTGTYYYKASSAQAQELFFGNTKLESINAKKFQSLGFCDFTWALENPHILA